MPLDRITWIAEYTDGSIVKESDGADFYSLKPESMAKYYFSGGKDRGFSISLGNPHAFFIGDEKVDIQICEKKLAAKSDLSVVHQMSLIQYKEAFSEIRVRPGRQQNYGCGITSYNIGFKATGIKFFDHKINLSIIMHIDDSGESFTARIVSDTDFPASLIINGRELSVKTACAEAVTWDFRPEE